MITIETTLWDHKECNKQIDWYDTIHLAVNIGDEFYIAPKLYIVTRKCFQIFHSPYNKHIRLCIYVKPKL